MDCPSKCLRYQSPIDLSSPTGLLVHQRFCLSGKNLGATFDPKEKIFIINDRIILKIKSGNITKRYLMLEYHFHLPGEHQITTYESSQIYPGEIHYVFTDNLDCQSLGNICGNNNEGNQENQGNIFVIGRGIVDHPSTDFDILQLNVKKPKHYYLYDGALTGGDVSTPVRWVVGNTPLAYPLEEIQPYAKTARSLQALDGRLILLGKSS